MVKVILLSWENSDQCLSRRVSGPKLSRQRYVYRRMEDDVNLIAQAFRRYNHDVEHVICSGRQDEE